MAETKRNKPLSSNIREIEILKKHFASSDGEYSLLRSIRNLFLGFDITASEIAVIKSVFKDKEVKNAFRKKMYPILSADAAVGEESDFWFGTETEIIDKNPDTIYQVIQSKQLCLEMLEKAFELLNSPVNGKIDLTYKPDFKIRAQNSDGMLQTALLTRNKYVKTVVTGLAIVKMIAGMVNETPEQAKDRLLKNSTQ